MPTSLDFLALRTCSHWPVISAGLSGFVELTGRQRSSRLPWRTFSLTRLNPSIVCDLDRPADWRVERPQIWACHPAQRSASFFGPTYLLSTSRALRSPSPEKEKNWELAESSAFCIALQLRVLGSQQVPGAAALVDAAQQQQQQQEFSDQKRARAVFGFCIRIRASLSASSRPPLDNL